MTALRLFATPALPRVPQGAITWIFVAIVAAMLAVAVYSVQMVAAGRTFMAAEARWAKAQRDAAFHLSRYLQNRSPEDYLAVQSALGVIEGTRAAREELAKAKPDMRAVTEQLGGAGLNEGEVEDIAFLADQLRGLEPSRYLASLWRQSDLLIEE